MVTDLFFAFIRLVVRVVSAVLPTWTPINLDPFLTAVEGMAGPVFDLLAWANWYLPVNEALICAGLGLPLYAVAVIYRGGFKVGRTVHLFGSR